jgi:hypothetical protein
MPLADLADLLTMMSTLPIRCFSMCVLLLVDLVAIDLFALQPPELSGPCPATLVPGRWPAGKPTTVGRLAKNRLPGELRIRLLASD